MGVVVLLSWLFCLGAACVCEFVFVCCGGLVRYLFVF